MNPASNNQKLQDKKLQIAVIGSGISGLTSAYLLSQQHKVSLFEAGNSLGGHTNTEHLEIDGKTIPVNTGFIVFNDKTYPNFIKLIEKLGLVYENSNMSFSVRCEKTGLAYNGTSLNSLFAQRKNLFKPAFIKMVFEILRFNRESTQLITSDNLNEDLSLAQHLKDGQYSQTFIDYYIVPMGAAIWSASVEALLNFPLKFFLNFFNHHGMLSVNDRPQWLVLKGGSESYIEPLIAPLKKQVYLNCPVSSIKRSADRVIVTSHKGTQCFDQVVLACHSDQALKLLKDPTTAEVQVLGAIPYQENQVTLHTDTSLMPKEALAWASWNYHIPKIASDKALVTYHMNQLQNLTHLSQDVLVTLNRLEDIEPNKIIKTYQYAHPVFSPKAVAAQQQHASISGLHRTHYCGAYWFNGFHEDGVRSAFRVCEDLGASL